MQKQKHYMKTGGFAGLYKKMKKKSNRSDMVPRHCWEGWRHHVED